MIDTGNWLKVLLRQQYQTKCQNEELKTKKDFFVEKSESKKKDYDWDFKVFLDKDGCGILSELNANTPGRCNKVETFAGSEGCGLATTLMEICFEDENVGGVDPENDPFFVYSFPDFSVGENLWRQMANENREHIVYLQCRPRAPISPVACSAYLTAAINTEHAMMFTFSTMSRPVVVIDVKGAQSELRENAYKFMRDFGDQWLFCKCKKENMDKCHDMS